MSLNLKLNLLVGSILLLVLTVTIMIIDQVVSSHQRESFQKQLSQASLGIQSNLKKTGEKMRLTTRLVGELPVLSTVVENGDPQTALDSANVYREKLGYPVLDLFDLDGQVLAEAGVVSSDETEAGLSQNIEMALDGESSLTYAIRNHKLMQCAIVPLGLEDDPSGVILSGVFLDNEFCRAFKEETNANLVVLLSGNIIASSIAKENLSTYHKELVGNSGDEVSSEVEVVELNLDIAMRFAFPEIDGDKDLAGFVLISKRPLMEVLSSLRWRLILTGVVAFFLALVAVIVFSGSLTKPIRLISDFSSKVSQGILNERISIERKDELGTLAEESGRMAKNLSVIVRDIRKEGLTLESSSLSLGKVSSQLYSDANEAQVQVGQSNEAIKRMIVVFHELAEKGNANSSSVLLATRSLQEVNASFHRINELCRQEKVMVANAVTYSGESKTMMRDLGKAVSQIGQVLSVINDIASKTNLLALNATIEAASAGEAGRGFSVVANEIKGLASKTTSATSEIESYIESISQQTQRCEDSNEKVLHVIQEVSRSSGQVSDVVTEQSDTTNGVSEMMRKMSSSIQENSKQLSSSLADADKITASLKELEQTILNNSENTHLVQECSRTLGAVSDHLNELVAKFRIEKG